MASINRDCVLPVTFRARLCTVLALSRPTWRNLSPSVLVIPLMSIPQEITFELRGDFIALDSLLKATGLADSGGRAKTMVAEGMVQVDGQDESRKTCKIRAGQVVSLSGVRIRVVAEPVSSSEAP